MPKISKLFTPTILMLSVIAPVPASAAGTAAFTIDEASYSVTLPNDFCMPRGVELSIADRLSNLDRQNETLLHVFHCAADKDDYLIVKVQKERQRIPLAKPLFLSIVAEQVQSEFGQQVLDSEASQAEESIADRTDGEVRMSDSTMRFGGSDADCVYLAGSSMVEDAMGIVTVRSASCITLIGSYTIAYHAYGRKEDNVSMDTLKARARALAIATTVAGS